MKALLLALLVVLAFPATALAKGATEARVDGPGFHRTFGLEHGSQAAMADIAEYSGFYHAIFAAPQSPIRPERPAGDLGPKYTVEWVLPGPNGEDSTIRQELYPYAKPSPVAFVEPGQRYWSGERTRGGWFVGNEGLTWVLEDAGFPATPPGEGFDVSLWWVVLGAALLAAATLGLRRARADRLAASRRGEGDRGVPARDRRRPGPARLRTDRLSADTERRAR